MKKEESKNVGLISVSLAAKRRLEWQATNKETVLDVGDYVKIGRACKDCSIKENFWVRITQTKPFKGIVDNDLVHNLGFKCGQEIEFERKEIQRRIEKR